MVDGEDRGWWLERLAPDRCPVVSPGLGEHEAGRLCNGPERDAPATFLPSACAGCGRDADAVIDDRAWCVDCFHESASCCAGEE